MNEGVQQLTLSTILRLLLASYKVEFKGSFRPWVSIIMQKKKDRNMPLDFDNAISLSSYLAI